MISELLKIIVVIFCSTQVITEADELSVDSLEKRAPGWGKRSPGAATELGYLQTVLSDLSRYEENSLGESPEADMEKRRPGWGKRGFPEGDFESMDKRRPGWGKRSYEYDIDTMETKRAPGWGKRDDGHSFNDNLFEDSSIDKPPKTQEAD
ncbi:ARNP-like protein [Mya arenaria]|uniref:ARNP-like protein n=1 Tax=Mya arenaria TaxID=6604 RepID=A0ABY7FF92_MYAAR|nr:ARNP-like protein [Mya arenaria]